MCVCVCVCLCCVSVVLCCVCVRACVRVCTESFLSIYSTFVCASGQRGLGGLYYYIIIIIIIIIIMNRSSTRASYSTATCCHEPHFTSIKGNQQKMFQYLIFVSFYTFCSTTDTGQANSMEQLRIKPRFRSKPCSLVSRR